MRVANPPDAIADSQYYHARGCGQEQTYRCTVGRRGRVNCVMREDSSEPAARAVAVDRLDCLDARVTETALARREVLEDANHLLELHAFEADGCGRHARLSCSMPRDHFGGPRCEMRDVAGWSEWEATAGPICEPEHVAECRTLCARMDADACADLGGLYRRGSGVAQSEGTARALFRKACTHGAQRGCAAEQQALQEDEAGVQLCQRDRPACRTACEHGNTAACRAGAAELQAGRLGAVDVASAEALLRRGCAAQDPESCVALGQRLAATHDPAGARDADRVACRFRDARACHALLALIEKREIEPQRSLQVEALSHLCLARDERACQETRGGASAIGTASAGAWAFYQRCMGSRADTACEELLLLDP
jgi:hypothetical protein